MPPAEEEGAPVRPTDKSTQGKSKTIRKQTKTATVQSWGVEWLEFEEEAGLVKTVWCRVCTDHYRENGV